MTIAGVLAAAPTFPHMLLSSALAKQANAGPSNEPILVLIQLQGGNDGLNTIVPFGSNLYYADRPNIAVPSKSVLPIDGMVGFNPNLVSLKALYDKGSVAIIQGAGYPNPSRSHFQGTTIWETADPTATSTTGWIGRYLDQSIGDTGNPLAAIALGPRVPQTFLSLRAPVTAIEDINTFRFALSRTNASLILRAYSEMYGTTQEKLPETLSLVRTAGANAENGVRDLQGITSNYQPAVQYPKSILAAQLQLVSRIISANLGTRVFHVTINGFDDHVAEVYQHAQLLKMLGDGLKAFYDDLAAHGKADQVLSMTFSEFGRRVKENAGRGTDHGTAAPMFIVGGKVKGGMYGQDPVLGKLDPNGDLIYGLDFRSVYGTILDKWMGASSTEVLAGRFEVVGFL
jgi:uncharacterized protein (DUF1501 family)